jgi:hypothetical protein
VEQLLNLNFEVLNFEFPNFEVRPAQTQIEFELDDLMVRKQKQPGGFEAPLTPLGTPAPLGVEGVERRVVGGPCRCSGSGLINCWLSCYWNFAYLS